MQYDNRKTQEQILTDGETILNKLIGVCAISGLVILTLIILGQETSMFIVIGIFIGIMAALIIASLFGYDITQTKFFKKD